MFAGLAAVVALAGASAALADHKPGHPPKPAKAGKKAKTQQGNSGGKVTVCHRTESASNPHRTIRVSQRAWERAHEKHGDSMGPCAGDEPRGTTQLESTLGAAPGVTTTATGTFHADVRLLRNQARVCYTLNVSGLTATAAHIHTFAAQTIGSQTFAAGGIVVPLKTPTGGVARGCTRVSRAVGEELSLRPAEFYVNVHTAAHPGGEIQGTLAVES